MRTLVGADSADIVFAGSTFELRTALGYIPALSRAQFWLSSGEAEVIENESMRPQALPERWGSEGRVEIVPLDEPREVLIVQENTSFSFRIWLSHLPQGAAPALDEELQEVTEAIYKRASNLPPDQIAEDLAELLSAARFSGYGMEFIVTSPSGAASAPFSYQSSQTSYGAILGPEPEGGSLLGASTSGQWEEDDEERDDKEEGVASKTILSATIRISGTPDQGRAIREALLAFLIAHDLELAYSGDEVVGSWLQHLGFRPRGFPYSDQEQEILQELRLGIAADTTSRIAAEVDNIRADSVSKLLDATSGVEEVVIVVGQILFIKSSGRISVRIVDALTASRIENSARLLAEPERLLQFVGEPEVSFGENATGLIQGTQPASAAEESA